MTATNKKPVMQFDHRINDNLDTDWQGRVYDKISASLKNKKPKNVSPSAAIHLEVEIHIPLPKEFSKVKRLMTLRKKTPPIHHGVCTNTVIDYIVNNMYNTYIMSYTQVVQITARKTYSTHPGVAVLISGY